MTPANAPAGVSVPGFSHYTFRSTDGINLHYVMGGTGQPILLWHGFLETWYCWRKIMPQLARQYTVIVPDMRGYGDSDKPTDGYDAQTLADDFRELVRHLGFDKITLVAHDMGAPTALVYAGQHPDEVRAVVYLDEPVLTGAAMQQVIQFTPDATKNGGLWWWAFALAGDMPERLIVGREREYLNWFYQNYTRDPATIEPAAVDEYLRTFAAPGGVTGAFGVYRAVFETIRQTEPYRQTKIKVPVLGLGGALSMGDNVRQMLTDVCESVTGDSVAQCGHFIPDEQPDYLIAQINQFMQGVPT